MRPVVPEIWNEVRTYARESVIAPLACAKRIAYGSLTHNKFQRNPPSRSRDTDKGYARVQSARALHTYPTPDLSKALS